MHYPHAPHRSDYFTCYRRNNWKVIYHYFPSAASEDSHYQLYKLDDDPFEQNNLAASQNQIGQLRRMMHHLIASLNDHNALYPVDKADDSTPLQPKLP